MCMYLSHNSVAQISYFLFSFLLRLYFWQLGVHEVKMCISDHGGDCAVLSARRRVQPLASGEPARVDRQHADLLARRHERRRRQLREVDRGSVLGRRERPAAAAPGHATGHATRESAGMITDMCKSVKLTSCGTRMALYSVIHPLSRKDERFCNVWSWKLLLQIISCLGSRSTPESANHLRN